MAQLQPVDLPVALQQALSLQWQQLCAAIPALIQLEPSAQAQLQQLLAASPFAGRVLQQQPELYARLLTQDASQISTAFALGSLVESSFPRFDQTQAFGIVILYFMMLISTEYFLSLIYINR